MEYEIWYGMGDIFLHIVTHDISYDTMNKLQISVIRLCKQRISESEYLSMKRGMCRKKDYTKI